MNSAVKFFKFIGFEAITIILSLVLINNFIGKSDSKINADGVGYYDYLPSIFIYKDFNRKDEVFSADNLKYKRIDSLGLCIKYGDYRLNKYTCGTAILESPFFIFTYLRTNRTGDYSDGYQSIFQKSIFHAALFYLFLTLLFFKMILRKYGVNSFIIFFIQLLLVLGTNVFHYSSIDAGYSHIYSLFAITAFIYFAQVYFNEKRVKFFLIACAFLGLIFLLRQINIIIILFIPFIAGSYANLKEGIVQLFKKPAFLLLGFSIISAIIFIQCFLWYLQVGSFITYSYQGEGFNFLDPEIFNVLFSYNKGLFVYTPIIFVTLFGVAWFILKKEYYLFFSWFLFFSVLTYFLSAWWCWNYGCSLGLRAYIDFYSVFFIPFALMLKGKINIFKIIIILFSCLSIPINIIQTYQYKEYILHWGDMGKESFWKVFLKTEDNFKGLLWKKKYDFTNYTLIKKIKLGDISSAKNKSNLLGKINSSEIPEFDKVSIIKVVFENDFNEKEFAIIVLNINDLETGKNLYYHNPFLIHFSNKQLNKHQKGVFNFEFKPIESITEKEISLHLETRKRNIDLKNVEILFFKIK